MKNILVIGNGFDLACGKKTAYTDFVARVEAAFNKEKDARDEVDARLTELCNVNGFFRHFHFLEEREQTWSFFEREMGRIVEALARFCDVVEKEQRDPEFDLTAYNMIFGLYSYEELQIYQHFARIFELIFDDPSGGMLKLRQSFFTPERKLNKKRLVEEVRRELDDFTAALDFYLTACVEGAAGAEAAPEDFTQAGDAQTGGAQEGADIAQPLTPAPDYVINFTYTDTIVRCGVPEEHIFYAKGRAGSEPVNLVLGCPGRPPKPGGKEKSSPPEGAKRPPLPIGKADWLPLEDDFQKLMKFIGWPDRAQLHPADAQDVTVACFGYSFPEWDAELLRELWDAAAQMIVYYTDREDYAQKLIRLFALFGKKEVTEAVSGERLVFIGNET